VNRNQAVIPSLSLRQGFLFSGRPTNDSFADLPVFFPARFTGSSLRFVFWIGNSHGYAPDAVQPPQEDNLEFHGLILEDEKMLRFRNLLAVLLAMSMLLAACSPAAAPAPTVMPTAVATQAPTTAPTAVPTEVPAATPTSAAIVLVDGQGTEFRLEQPAQRIISLAPSNTEILFAVGAGAQVVARDDFSNYPEQAAGLPSVGGSMMNYNLEEITKQTPDLVLASPLTPTEQISAMQAITPNIFVVPNPTDLEGLYDNLLNVGALTGHSTEAEALVSDLRTRAKAVTDKVATASEKPKVFYELDATDPAKPWTAGPGNFVDTLIGLAGGQNIGAALQGEWAQISQEELLVQNPDIILLGDALYGGITPESVAARPGWDAIAAVKNQRVEAFNDDLVSRPGPRIIDGLEALATAFHPDLFK
jgi:iron complex transport system substrate-binding protein